MTWFEAFYTEAFFPAVGFADEAQTEREAAFVAEALDLEKGARVLDLACGYGRHARLLAENHELQVVGYDLSEDYLNIAREKFNHRFVSYVRGDMRRPPFNAEFDGTVNLFTSFGFFETDEENQLVLDGVAKSLRRGGKFLLDYENKFYFVADSVVKNPRFRIDVDEKTYILGEHRYDIEREREVLEARLMRDGQEIERSGYNIRLYGVPEITRMLNAAGLEVEAFWGDYGGSALSALSRRMIIRARKV